MLSVVSLAPIIGAFHRSLFCLFELIDDLAHPLLVAYPPGRPTKDVDAILPNSPAYSKRFLSVYPPAWLATLPPLRVYSGKPIETIL